MIDVCSLICTHLIFYLLTNPAKVLNSRLVSLFSVQYYISRRVGRTSLVARPVLLLQPPVKHGSPSGNRTPVARVTGGNTHHYTTEEVLITTDEVEKIHAL